MCHKLGSQPATSSTVNGNPSVEYFITFFLFKRSCMAPRSGGLTPPWIDQAWIIWWIPIGGTCHRFEGDTKALVLPVWSLWQVLVCPLTILLLHTPPDCETTDMSFKGHNSDFQLSLSWLSSIDDYRKAFKNIFPARLKWISRTLVKVALYIIFA